MTVFLYPLRCRDLRVGGEVEVLALLLQCADLLLSGLVGIFRLLFVCAGGFVSLLAVCFLTVTCERVVCGPGLCTKLPEVCDSGIEPLLIRFDALLRTRTIGLRLLLKVA